MQGRLAQAVFWTSSERQTKLGSAGFLIAAPCCVTDSRSLRLWKLIFSSWLWKLIFYFSFKNYLLACLDICVVNNYAHPHTLLLPGFSDTRNLFTMVCHSFVTQLPDAAYDNVPLTTVELLCFPAGRFIAASVFPTLNRTEIQNLLQIAIKPFLLVSHCDDGI